MTLDPTLEATLKAQVEASPVVLYMKGTPTFPMCGFSSQVVAVLKHYGVAFEAINVLEDETVRQGIKVFSQWPTIPQLYVRGTFIGGCDIVQQLHERGELAAILTPDASPA